MPATSTPPRRGVHLVTLHLRAAQHRFRFRRVKKQLVLQEPHFVPGASYAATVYDDNVKQRGAPSEYVGKFD